MRLPLWLRVRRLEWIIATLAGSVVVLVLIGSLTLTLPVFGWISGVQVPLALLAPAAPLLALAAGLANSDPQLEAVSVRSTALLDLALIGSVAFTMALSCAVIEAVGLSPLGFAAARNAIGLAGLMLLAAPFGNSVLALTPVAFLLLVSGFGSSGTGEPDWWAWPVQPAASTTALALAFVLAIGGVVTFTSARAFQTKRLGRHD